MKSKIFINSRRIYKQKYHLFNYEILIQYLNKWDKYLYYSSIANKLVLLINCSDVASIF
jgi:hypothetical protein